MISRKNVTVGILDKRVNRYGNLKWSPSAFLIFLKCTLKDIIDIIRQKKKKKKRNLYNRLVDYCTKYTALCLKTVG